MQFKLFAFDGDDTLWTPTGGINLSDRTIDDDDGWPDFTFEAVTEDTGTPVAKRDDGALFTLRPEAPAVLRTLKERGAVTGVISYNHQANVLRVLEAFGISQWVDYVVAEWHSNKDRMLRKMLEQARLDGRVIEPRDAVLVDDDPYSIYRGQCARMGAGFRCFGQDIQDLSELLAAGR